MHTVAYTELMADALVAHQLMHGAVDIKQEVIIATIKEPFHRTQLFQGSLIGITHEINGGMTVDRLTGLVQAIMFLRRFLLEIITCKPGTHSETCTKALWMTLAITGAATTTHRKSHHGAVSLL